MSPRRSSRTALVVVVAIALVAIACSAGRTSPTVPPAPVPIASPTATPTPLATSTPGPSIASTGGKVTLEVVADRLDLPVDIAIAGDGSGRIFIVEQGGTIAIVKAGSRQETPFLDISRIITSGGERGLLGLAFHPDYPADPRFFVDYTNDQGDTVIASIRVDPTDPAVADPNSELILLTIKQPFANHNGGSLAFGTDGMLLVGMGDGGDGGDPQGNGQRLDTLLGKILRLDVLGLDADLERPYGIPVDNPYADGAKALPEIWLSGLRNPWRMRVDDSTGILWIGDVGQGSWEEIDAIAPTMGGSNLGWNTMEGAHCFSGGRCDQAGLTLPVSQYGHDLGCSVTGGVVTRSATVPAVQDRYLFSDFCSGTIWSIDASTTALTEPDVLFESGRSISAIALDDDGSVLLTDLGGGQLLRLVSAP